jgi:hypothetical protein
MTEQGGEGSDWVEGTYESGADPEPRREGQQPDGRGAEIGLGEASSFEPEEDEEQGSEQQPRDARGE